MTQETAGARQAALFRAPVLAVQAGLPAAVLMALTGDASRPVRDGDGATVAVLAKRVREGGTALRLLKRVVGGPDRRWVVAEPDGTPLLLLRASSGDLTVTGPAGEPLGVARNASRPGASHTRIDVVAGEGKRRDAVLATFGGSGDQTRFDHEVRDAGGMPVGRVANAGDGTYVLTLLDGASEPVRTLLAGVLCGLVERAWWRLPQGE